jgi:hypothetical protein
MINDGEINAEVTHLDNSSPFAKAGLMIRASTDPSAPHVTLDVKPDGGLEFMTRGVAGGQTTVVASDTNAFPVFLILQRSGSTITAWYSRPNTTQLFQLGSVSIDLPSVALAGAIVTSHERGTLATATFSQIRR